MDGSAVIWLNLRMFNAVFTLKFGEFIFFSTEGFLKKCGNTNHGHFGYGSG
jgi:hypothetical protein